MSWAALLEAAEAIRSQAARQDDRAARLPVAGIGWATVDHERAERDLDALLGPVGAWEPAPRDAVLGAGGWWRGGVPAGGSSATFVMLLEPDTEGRLAASLARFGEGVAVVYLGRGGPGPGELVRGGPAWGPFAVLLDPGRAAEPRTAGR